MKKYILSLVICLPIFASAQETKDTTIAIPTTETTIRMAAELAKYGYSNKDALSLIQAARIAKTNGFTQEEKVKDGADEARPMPPEPAVKLGKISLDPDELLKDAQTMAKDDGVLLALIEDVKSGVRGAVGGPRYHRDRVNANSTDYYAINFRAGELAIVTVVGDGDTDLDLLVYDSNGNLIDSDNDYSDNCVCTWTPRWTGKFTIKIINRGGVYNNYVLRTN